MTIRLLHTADWQLGKPFTRFEGDTGALLREARFEVVAALARLATEHRVDAVLVAGDILDNEHSQPAVLRRMVAQLRTFSGPWLLLPGNHDPARPGGLWDRFRATGDCPGNVHVLDEAKPLTLADGRLVVLPAPLHQRQMADDPTCWLDGANLPDGVFKVGLAHGSVAACLPAGAASGNPIALDRAERAGLDYLALGDWHSSREIGPRTWYSGTPEPDDYTASGIGEALLVTVEAPGAPVSVQPLRTGRFTWRTAALDLGAGCDTAALEDRLEQVQRDLGTRADTLLRLGLEGSLDLAARAGLADALDRRAAGLRHLELRDEKLMTVPSEADLAAFAADPLLASAARRLGAGNDPIAALALRLLHDEWRRAETGP